MSLKDRLPKLSIPGRRRREAGDAAAEPAEPVMAAGAGQILRGYGPLAAFALLFVLMAGFVPTVNQSISNTPGFAAPSGDGGSTYSPTEPGSTDDEVPTGGEGQTASGTGAPASGSGSSGTKVAAQPGRGEGSCAGKTKQVPGDPYSPPCMEWAGGDNGGATHRGVFPDKIKVSFRVVNEKGFLQTLATLAGAEIVDTPADIKRTVTAFEEFFNKHYQFYGRKLEISFYDGRGSTTAELLGGGRAEAEADAEEVAKKHGAFIEMNGASEPFANALWKRGVIAFGTPYLSRKWHNDRRPYGWSVATDCSIVAEVAAELANKTLAGKKATFAGDALKDDTRVLAGLSPENEWYQVCHDDAIRTIQAAGNDPGLKINYKLDINSMSNQAANVIAKLKDGGATTILCGCDPIFPVFLTAKANEQDYEPEWVVLGTALTDWAVAAQLYNQQNWSHAFGVSSLGEPRPVRAGLGYTAYKSIRPDEPAFAVELIYGTLLLISSGIQMAGPQLDPGTFEAGLLNWPGGTGPYGTWGFEARDYTPTRDYRIVWWDPDRIAIENNQPGAYVTAYGGQRYAPGNLPSGDLQVFGG